MTKAKIQAKGMHCRSCEMLIKDSLMDLNGVKNVIASHKSGIVEVDFDNSKIDVDKIKEAIGKEGYKVM